MSLPAAGWFPNPDPGGSGLRWWDGEQWTQHYHPDAPGSSLAATSAATTSAASGTAAADTAVADSVRESIGGLLRRAQKVTGNVLPGSAAPRPGGHPVEPWANPSRHEKVVGESHYGKAFSALAGDYGHRSVPERGVELKGVTAQIVREPDNRFDPDAVAVWIDGRHQVGYLSRTTSSIYAPQLDKLDPGTVLSVPARVWACRSAETREVWGSASLTLPDPEGVLPFNDLPDEPHVVLPHGKAIQVTGEEAHMEVLRTFVLGIAPRHVAATLHLVEQRGVELVEVHLDGHRVGILTKGMSEQTRDLVRFVQDAGKVPVCRAVLKGSDLRADVALHVARTVDVPHRWLQSIGVM